MTFWQHTKAEARESWSTIATWARRAFVFVAALHLLAGIWYLVAGDGSLGDRTIGTVAVAVYGLFQGAIWGAGIGVTAMVLRLAGWGTMVPFVLIPIGVWLSCHLGAGWVGGAGDELLKALGDRAGELGSVRMSCGHPVLALILLPIVAVHFLGSGAVMGALLKVLAISIALVLVGALVGAVISIPPVIATTVARMLRRAKDRAVAAEAETAG